MSNIVSPYEELLSVIDGLESELKEYKKSPKVVEYVVKKRSELIIQLSKVLNNILIYDTNAIVTSLTHKISEIKKMDSEIDSLLIRVDYVPNGKKTGFIKIAAHK